MPSWSECLQPPPFLSVSNISRSEALENEDTENRELPIYRQPRSLIELCAKYVISDVSLCETCLTAGMTQTLFEHLFTAAIENMKDLSIQALISQWPHTSLSLASHGGRSESDFERQLHRWLTGEIRVVDERDGISVLSVIQAFINSLRKRAPSHLRVLDLRGFPCIDYGIEYLTSHSMLAYNESQRASIVRLVQDMATNRRITSEQALAFGNLTDLQTTLPEHSYAVIVDCVIDSEGRALVELCKTLKISPFTHAHLKLILNQLHLCELGTGYVELIMPLLNPAHLVGLNVSFNGLQAAGLNHVLGNLEVGKFDALQRLDLGINNIDFSVSDLACQHFSSAFSHLRQLKRLDLRGNRLSRRLRTLFSPSSTFGLRTSSPRGSFDSIGQGIMDNRRLEYLNLSGCRLMESDFIFLSNTSLIDEIRELDLSDNNFASSTSSLCCVLKRIRSSVRALRLDRCSIRDQQAERIVSSHLAMMSSLVALSLADNVWTTATYHQEVSALIKGCITLRGVRISYPVEIYHDQHGNGNGHDEQDVELARQMRKTSFYCNLMRLVENAKTGCRPFRLVMAELDETLL